MKRQCSALLIALTLFSTLSFAGESKPLNRPPIEVVKDYFRYLDEGNIEALLALFDDTIEWHQPGANKLSKTYQGKEELGQLFQNFHSISQGTFKIEKVDMPLMSNGEYIVANLEFSGYRCGYVDISMKMKGTDLIRVVDGKIVEVRLFSEKPEEEDRFWGKDY